MNLNHSVENGINCLYTNTDVLHNKIDELQTYIKENKIEIIAITETLPKDVAGEDYNPIFLIDGFNSYSNHDGRGVVIFVNNSSENQISINRFWKYYYL